MTTPLVATPLLATTLPATTLPAATLPATQSPATTLIGNTNCQQRYATHSMKQHQHRQQQPLTLSATQIDNTINNKRSTKMERSEQTNSKNNYIEQQHRGRLMKLHR
jgi:hypothetical protein